MTFLSKLIYLFILFWVGFCFAFEELENITWTYLDTTTSFVALHAKFEILNEVKRMKMRAAPAFFRPNFVVLPICDWKNPPLGWRYIKEKDDFYFLAYMDSPYQVSPLFVWKGNIWVRLFRNQFNFLQEGMKCNFSEAFGYENYIQIILNQNIFSELLEGNKVLLMHQNNILQLEAKSNWKQSEVKGFITFSSLPGLDSEDLYLEIWEKKHEGWFLLKKTTNIIFDKNESINKWEIRAKASFSSEVRMLFKVSEKGLSRILQHGFLGRLFIYEAQLTIN